MMGGCRVEGCEKQAHARGWCVTHYARWRNHGDPTIGARLPRNVDPCSVDGCSKTQKARGYCDAHWARWRKYGDPLGKATRPSLGERFLSLVNKQGPVGISWNGDVLEEPCWLWAGSVMTIGYGTLSVADTPCYAHRVAYELFVGPIPDGLTIDHLCMVRTCVNPTHLEAVTREENSRRACRASGKVA